MDIKVTVIIPVYNVSAYLKETLDSLLSQSLKEIELICVDDGSSDNSLEILREYEEKDSRVRCFAKENGGAGAARNFGMNYANGKYLYFFDSDDIAAPNLLELTYDRAEQADADFVAFHGYTFTDGDIKNKKLKQGYNKNILRNKDEVFSYKDYPDNIISLVNVVPWNKLIRADFIRKNNILFEEISSTNDITFSALCNAKAERIALVNEPLMYYRLGHSGTVSSTKSKNLNNVITAVESAVKQISESGNYEQIKYALIRFVVDNYCFSFMNYLSDFSSEQSKSFYEYIRKSFCSKLFDGADMSRLNNNRLSAMFLSIKSRSYEEMAKLRSAEMIVSLTTYPKRIKSVVNVVKNMLRQTKKADKICLYLASEQFPEREAALPQELLNLCENECFSVIWCDDLRSHKKYFYAMQDNPHSLIVTVDDDLFYPDNLLETLYYSYICHPDCVSAMRTHIVTFDKDNKSVCKYSRWINEFRKSILIPSYQLFATSGAGTLFPPNSLDERAFDKKRIFELCPFADDVWLNMMQLAKGTKTVLAADSFYLHYLEGTQDESLSEVNILNNKNDTQYDSVRSFLASEFGYDIILERLMEKSSISFISVDELCDYISYQSRDVIRNLTIRLQETFDEKSEINAKLQKTYKEKAQRGNEIRELKLNEKKLLRQIDSINKEVSMLKRRNEALQEKNRNLQKYRKYSLYRIVAVFKRLLKK